MKYSQEYYDQISKDASESAQSLVTLVYNKLKPKSILDVGCADGTWLREWSSFLDIFFGVDGKWVDQSVLKISQENFKKIDLQKKFNLNRTFDLVTCLEVAEHIPKKSKDNFIDSLICHGDIILFSAAVPEQGGKNHYNEKWQSYWIYEFKKRGYVFLDPFRHLIWNNANIKYYYRQNLILFVKAGIINSSDFLSKEKQVVNRSLVDVVHPLSFDENNRTLKKVFPIFLKTLRRACKNRLGF